MLQQGAVPVEQALAPHLGQAGGRVLFQTGEEAVACLLELLPLGGEIQGPAGIEPDIAAVLAGPEDLALGAHERLVGLDAQQAEAADAAVVQKAIALLKKDKMLGMVLSVETDAVFNQEQETEQVTKTTQTIIKMIADAFQVVSAQPALLPLYRQMIETVAATMPRSRPFEAVIEQCFAKVEVELNKPEP